jgi:hypothetical protein
VLEVKVQAKHVSDWTWIETTVNTWMAHGHLWVKTIVLSEDEWVLNQDINTSTDTLILACCTETIEGIAQSDVVNAKERGVANKEVAHVVISLAYKA